MKPTARKRLSALVSVAVIGAAVVACATPRIRFVPAVDRGANLPESPAELWSIADAVGASDDATAREIDRAIAALEKAASRGADTYEVAWRWARAASQMIDVLHFPDERRRYATEGQAHAQRAVEAGPDRVEGHYVLAIMIARMAEASNDIELIKEAVAEAERAVAIDASYDHAAALRFLGKIYITAPAWPTSVGAPDKAVEVLERALSLAPHPLSRVFLGQAYYHDEEFDQAREHLKLALVEAERVPLADRWIAEARDYLRRLGSASGPSEGSDF